MQSATRILARITSIKIYSVRVQKIYTIFIRTSTSLFDPTQTTDLPLLQKNQILSQYQTLNFFLLQIYHINKQSKDDSTYLKSPLYCSVLQCRQYSTTVCIRAYCLAYVAVTRATAILVRVHLKREFLYSSQRWARAGRPAGRRWPGLKIQARGPYGPKRA